MKTILHLTLMTENTAETELLILCRAYSDINKIVNPDRCLDNQTDCVSLFVCLGFFLFVDLKPKIQAKISAKVQQSVNGIFSHKVV